jgi:hypothetical protein
MYAVNKFLSSTETTLFTMFKCILSFNYGDIQFSLTCDTSNTADKNINLL